MKFIIHLIILIFTLIEHNINRVSCQEITNSINKESDLKFNPYKTYNDYKVGKADNQKGVDERTKKLHEISRKVERVSERQKDDSEKLDRIASRQLQDSITLNNLVDLNLDDREKLQSVRKVMTGHQKTLEGLMEQLSTITGLLGKLVPVGNLTNGIAPGLTPMAMSSNIRNNVTLNITNTKWGELK